MIIVTDPSNITPDILLQLQPVAFYNISSMKIMHGVPTLTIAPPQQLLYQAAINGSEHQLDLAYAEMLMRDENMFSQLMLVMKDLYVGKNVILFVYREEQVFDASTESLCKFIQQRYGYNYQIINSSDDINYNDKSTFTTGGIMNFDLDNSRYGQILLRVNPQSYLNENIAAENGYVV